MLIGRPWIRQKERNWFIEQLQHFALTQRIRVSFLSGDVHCAAVGVLKSLTGGKNKAKIDLPPPMDHRYMLNIVTSTSRRSMGSLR